MTATESTAQTTGVVTSFVGDDAYLRIGDSVRVSASGNTRQFADVSGILGGVLAVGSNDAEALSNTTTKAYIGDGVSLSGGDDIGGLTTGEQYFVVLDDERPFDSGEVDTSANIISLEKHGLQTGDAVRYQPGSGSSPIWIRQGANPVALAAGRVLYVIRQDADTIKLAGTEQDGLLSRLSLCALRCHWVGSASQ